MVDGEIIEFLAYITYNNYFGKTYKTFLQINLKGNFLFSEIWQKIEKSKNIVLASHKNPDGDALGSSLGFFNVLKKKGINAYLFNVTKQLPPKFDFLKGYDKIKSTFPKKCDLLIAFDCGNFDRLGIERGEYPIINIDHHRNNSMFGDLNLVDESAPSSSAIVFNMLKELNIEIGKDAANCFYAALVEDTGFFSYESVNKKVFDIASSMVEAGAEPFFVAKNLRERNSLGRMRLTALFINSLKLYKNATIACGIVTQEMFKKTGALRSDAEHLCNLARSLATVELSILYIEEEDGKFKVSLRSKNFIDVSKIALRFNGGGHKRSAGFETTEKDLYSLTKKIIKASGIL